MKIPVYQIDAFTDKAFGGNPAAVCPLEFWPENEIMQKIAAENNLSETAFFVNKGEFIEIKWFTPKVEIELCGHATLATAYVIFNFIAPEKEELKFQSMGGELIVTKENDLITLNFPARMPQKSEAPAGLAEALGSTPIEIYKSRDYVLLFESEKDIINLSPDFAELLKIDAHGFICTAPGDNSDFVSRFFAPQVGINEDPVTGSAHTNLIPFWAERLKKNKLHAFQLSERKGELFCEHLGERVLISGKAVKFLQGFIEIENPA